MPASITRLLRPDIAALEPYTPIVPLETLAEQLSLPVERIIKLDANENPYGPSPRALAALAAVARDAPHRYAIYPDPDHTRLRAALSRYIGQPPERIICGAGSDELIDLLMRAVLRPGDVMVDCPPTFAMYSFDAALYGARVVPVPRTEQFDIDVEGVAEAVERDGAKLLFLAAPNNPTGTPLTRAAVERLLDLPIILAIDEAYAEFAGTSVVDLVGTRPNLVVLRTFSKWAGLAGLRIGYAAMHEDVIAYLWKIKQPYNVNVAAEVAAIASLEDLEERMTTVARIVAERERLAAALATLPGVHVYPSAANFLLCRMTNGGAARARAIRDGLAQRGILIRYFNRPGLDDCIRISVGRPEQNDALLRALEDLM
ncbi:MAG: histidinol-phosphate transaminase [Roseiflexaceae bacterium]|nr:histidinol-phosphate transaminase [Roseiflexus sp.]MDW8145644.1 histidinol-phosphate transaminase [Roseiflexaceae bacterium]MDW8232880.1 histidinol-phosphate transaminase [Roseiflexaceae bacterium]